MALCTSLKSQTGLATPQRIVIWSGTDLILIRLNVICSWAALLPRMVSRCALCALLWLSPRCHYGRLESVTVLHLSNAVINSRDMGPIVSSPVTRCDVGYYPATSKLWEHSWHLVRCNTLVTTVSNIGSDTQAEDHISSQIIFSSIPWSWTTQEKPKEKFYFSTEFQKWEVKQLWSCWSNFQSRITFIIIKTRLRRWSKLNFHTVKRWVQWVNFAKMFPNELFRNGLQTFLSFWSPLLPM